jgi:hypothetical protein
LADVEADDCAADEVWRETEARGFYCGRSALVGSCLDSTFNPDGGQEHAAARLNNRPDLLVWKASLVESSNDQLFEIAW